MSGTEEMTFWDHLDALRSVLWRCVVLLALLTAAFFVAMPHIFDSVILGPTHADFPTYRFLSFVDGGAMGLPDFGGDFHVDLINVQLASQFFVHLTTSFWLALVAACPLLLYLLWGFVAPALYEREKRGASRAFICGTLMFYVGAAAGYYMVFPLTLRFLADYHVSEAVPNIISLDSYMDNFLMLIVVMGVVFELPIVAWILGRMGMLSRVFFRRYRRHAVVVLLIITAILTPTGDPFTLMVVFLPVYMLWELCGLLVPATVAIPEELRGK